MKIITYKDFKNIIKVVSNCLIVVLLTNILYTSIPVKAGSQYYLADFYSVTLQTLNKMGVITDDSFLYDNCWWFMTYYPLTDHDFDNISTDVKSFLVWSISEHYFYLNEVNDRYYYDNKWNDEYCVVNDIDSDAFRDAINRGINGKSVSDPSSHSGSHHSVSIDVTSEGIINGSIVLKVKTYKNRNRIYLYERVNGTDYCFGALYQDFTDVNTDHPSWMKYYNKTNLDSNLDSFWFYQTNASSYYFGYVPGTNCIVWNFSPSKLSVNTPYSIFEGYRGLYFCNSSSLSGINSNTVVGGHIALTAPKSNQSFYNIKLNNNGTIRVLDDYDSVTGEYIAHGSGSNFETRLLGSRELFAIVGDQLFYDDEGSFYYHNGVVYDLGVIDSPFNFVFNPPESASQNTASQNNTIYNFISVENTITEIVNNYYIYNTVSGNSSSYDDTNLLSILRQMNNKLDLILNRFMKIDSSGGNYTINDISLSIETSINNVFNTLFILNEDQKADIDAKLATLKSPFNWIFTFVDGFKGFINEFKARSAVYSSGYSIGNEYTDYFTTSGNTASMNMSYNGDINSGGNNIDRSSALVAPVIMAHFDNSTSDIFKVGDVVILDLSWYIPYKATVDQIIVLFCWVFFIWRLFKTIPSLLSGGDGYISAVEPSIRQNNIRHRGV